MQKALTGLIKDAVSLFIYIFLCPFRRNRSAVLVYHSVDNMPLSDDPLKINVAPDLFEKQMLHISGRKERFLVTIDDGYGNNYTHIFPVVRRLGINTILFVTTDYIDGKLALDRFFSGGRPVRPLTWGEIKEMAASGIELGSHSLSHRNMANLDESSARREAAASKERIRAMTGYDVSSFSYPFGNSGSFNEMTEQAVKSAGYEKAYTNIMGMDDPRINRFRINRIRIYSTDNLFRFKMKTAGAYNWVDRLSCRLSTRKSICEPGE